MQRRAELLDRHFTYRFMKWAFFRPWKGDDPLPHDRIPEVYRHLPRRVRRIRFIGVSWVKAYQAEGEAGLEQKKKPGNPLSRYERRKELSYEESLQYQVELPKRELVRKDAEVLRLKKRNER